MNTTMPKPDYPRPQLVREDWLNLNGWWQFESDQGDSGLERGLTHRELVDRILVPFCPESTASGIDNVDFLQAVWYRRSVEIPAAWDGRTVLLHFGAVDHDATVWVNGAEAGRHRGGFSSFTIDVTAFVRPGEDSVIVVRARDMPTGAQARGKQSTRYANSGCFYTRTTGIWQTVWLEPVHPAHIRSLGIEPQRGDASFLVTADLTHHTAGLLLEAELWDAAGIVCSRFVPADDLGPRLTLLIPSQRVRFWHPGDPHLYGLTVRLRRGTTVIDEVRSYAGLRSIAIDGTRVLLNGEPVSQRLVLDQGYWPDTLMTSPSDDALVRDITLAQEAGFNGARLHQKVVEERYLYHADRLGFLVWAEFGDWGAAEESGATGDRQHPTSSFITQWLEIVRRDRSHPSIVGWCPLNETYQALHDRITSLDDVTLGMYLAVKAADPTRPVIDASGYSHRVPGADVYDSHSYLQDPVEFARQQAGLSKGEPYVNTLNGQPMSCPYAGQPYFVSEYGGIWWNPEQALSADPLVLDLDKDRSWGYGEPVRDIEAWYTRFEGLTRVLLDDPQMFGYCYTQLTDVFQEQNGILTATREPKFDLSRLRDIQSAAAYESREPEAKELA